MLRGVLTPSNIGGLKTADVRKTEGEGEGVLRQRHAWCAFRCQAIGAHFYWDENGARQVYCKRYISRAGPVVLECGFGRR
ncbi:unnamed protein product, partial [Ectocarpus sp. 8 AP-2014]